MLREDRTDDGGEQRWHALFIGRLPMAKKSSASSQPEKLVRVKAEHIFNKPLTTWLKSRGPGHLSRINAILANVMDAEQRIKSA